MNEIEIRGKLLKDDFERLFEELSGQGKLLDHYHRLSIDLSPGFDPLTRTWKNDDALDLRIKKSGKSEKISLKLGKYHDQERREIDVRLAEGEILNTLQLFEALGFDKGMVYFWESWEFEYQGYEAKLSKYTDDYFTWEIESKDGKSDPNQLAVSLGLVPYMKDEYAHAIDWENNNIHQIYTPELVKKLLKEV